MKKILSLFSMVILLSACAGTPPLKVDNQEDAPPTFNPASPNPIITNPVTWKVINNDTLKQLSKANDPNLILYGLDPQSFENNLLNLQDTSRYIEQQNLNIQFYKNYNNSLGQQQPSK